MSNNKTKKLKRKARTNKYFLNHPAVADAIPKSHSTLSFWEKKKITKHKSGKIHKGLSRAQSIKCFHHPSQIAQTIFCLESSKCSFIIRLTLYNSPNRLPLEYPGSCNREFQKVGTTRHAKSLYAAEANAVF